MDTLKKSLRKYVIAIDFDGTLTLNHSFPDAGEPRTWLVEKAKKWKRDGHRLILWTCRTNVTPEEEHVFATGNHLDVAVEWCKEQGLEFDAINQNLEELHNPDMKFSRKIFADFYIDDRSVVFDDDDEQLMKKNFVPMPLL
jgi:hydroxymethylpyrimidine pyrophosphatase-like HAD family hydrolase